MSVLTELIKIDVQNRTTGSSEHFLLYWALCLWHHIQFINITVDISHCTIHTVLAYILILQHIVYICLVMGMTMLNRPFVSLLQVYLLYILEYAKFCHKHITMQLILLGLQYICTALCFKECDMYPE